MESLQTSLSDIPSAADLQTALDALTSQIQDIADNPSGASSQTLSDIQTDLEELLESNNIYSEDLTINSETLLEFAEKLNDRVAIINGTVTILYSPDLDHARLQAVVSKMKTIVGDLRVRATSNSVTPLNFDTITGVQNIIVSQPGSVSFANLKGVKSLTLGNNFESKVNGAINFKSLETVESIVQADVTTAFGTSSPTANSLVYTRATSINFDALKHYAPASLTLEGDEGFDLALSSLQTVNADGDDVEYTLSITGAANLTSNLIKKGTITVKDVDTVVLDAFIGSVKIDEGVRDVSLGSLSEDLSLVGATSTTPNNDLEHIKITAKGKETSKTVYPAINLQYAAALLDATISGTAKSVNFTDGDDLETATLSADFETVTFSGNGNLVALTATGKIKSLTINDCDDLETADLAYTNSDAAKGGTLVVTGNNNLTSFSANKVNNLNVLTIQSNSDLATISFDALKADATGTSKANIKIGGAPVGGVSMGNDLSASTITKNKTGGKFSSTSGLNDLKAYLTDAKAKAGAQIQVYFDTADTYTDNSGSTATSETNLVITDTNDVLELTVADVTETTLGTTIRETQSFVFPVNYNSLGGQESLASGEGIQLVYTPTGGTAVTKSWSNGAGGVNNIPTLISAINSDTTFTPANIKLTAARDANKAKHYSLDFVSGGSSTTVSGTGVITFEFGKGSDKKTRYLTTGNITTGQGQNHIATAIAASINGVNGYLASTTNNRVIVNRRLADDTTSNSDESSLAGAIPDIKILVDAAQTSTTVQFSSTASNTKGLADGDFALQETRWETIGVRFTIRNESAVLALGTVAVSNFGTPTALGSKTDLVPGTNMPASGTNTTTTAYKNVKALVAAFSDVTDPTTAGGNLNRIGWL